MKIKLTLATLTVAILGLSLYLYLTTNNFASDTTRLEEEISLARSNSFQPNEQSSQNSSTIDLTPNSQQELTEIVLTSDDIYLADSKGNIGSQTPFNDSYITKEDVIESINRIISGLNVDFESIESPYQNKFITLRHVEMVEGTPEERSSVLNAYKEYSTKILGSTAQDNSSETLYQADVSIAKTDKFLSEKD